ncbi:MAG: hypothetical protein H6697_00780 [Myxococcales bacterium]|nr:hypothetical protein [Myxococcales bacterium]MCB9521036.1 hypothetical protein [Myxococcales bacterium]
MKRTEIEKRERELFRAQKKADGIGRAKEAKSIGDYIDELFALFMFDDKRIFNTKEDIEVLDLLEEIREMFPDKTEVIVKKAIRKTKVEQKDEAYADLSELLG